MNGALAAAGAMTPQDFGTIAGMVHDAAGLVVHPGKTMMVASRLAPLLRRHGDATMKDYLDRVRRDPAEHDSMLGALTTNHTGFFREGHHFSHVHSIVRPALVQRLLDGGRVRLWSAGCSTGAEVYSLAMVMLGSDSSAARRLQTSDLRLLATDIAEHALAVGRKACWPAAEMAAVPEPLRRLWCDEADGAVTINAALRDLVSIRRLNLIEDWPITGTFDAIFCRNVMIYFDAATKQRLVCRFAQHLEPGGFLYIGHSERITGAAAALLEPAGNTIYRRTAAA